MHADEDLSEWGVAAALRYGNPGGLGPTAELRPVWGLADSGGMQALWRHSSVADASSGPPGQRRIELQFGYGTPMRHGAGVGRPLLAVSLRDRGRDYRLGYEAQLQNGLAVSASTVVREAADPWQPVAYGVSARASLIW